MNENIIQINITTQSNLFIGGTPQSFEIGGVDQYTVCNQDGLPYIPASTLKGCLRAIIRDHKDEEISKKIGESYRNFLENEKKKKEEKIKQLTNEEKENFYKRYEEVIKDSSAQYLFGIAGFGHTPKLIFNDLCLTPNCEENGHPIFSIDSKATIKEKENGLESKPRTYKTIAPNVTFQGNIILQKMEQLHISKDEIKKYLSEKLQLFNEGVYRLGNSKSRGYGKVNIIVSVEEEGL